MAVIVGNPFGTIYAILQLSGSDDYERMFNDGHVMDTTEYCREFRQFLTAFLANVDVDLFAIEEAVTYQDKKYHTSVMTLTEIRGSLIVLGQEAFGINKPIEINNMKWKGAVLPKGSVHRGEKASYEYLKDKGFADYSHDVTDAICMYLYMVLLNKDKYVMCCELSEESLVGYTYNVFPKSFLDSLNQAKVFKYNNKFSVAENCSYYANRATTRSGVCSVDVNDLNPEDIYGHTVGFNNPDEKEALLVVFPAT